MHEVQVKIKGLTPLLQNNPSGEDFDAQWAEKMATNDEQRQVLKKLYVKPDGTICQPATHIERTLCEAAKKIKMKGSGKATYSKIFGSMVSVSPVLIPHKSQEYSINKTTVVIPSTKGRVLCCRPMLENWFLEFTISFEDEIPEAVIEQALTIAGKYSGLGDWRPQKGGKYGKFEVVSFNIQPK